MESTANFSMIPKTFFENMSVSSVKLFVTIEWNELIRTCIARNKVFYIFKTAIFM